MYWYQGTASSRVIGELQAVFSSSFRGVFSTAIHLSQVFFVKIQKQPFRVEVFLRKGVLKICSKFTGEYLFRSLISIKLLCNFIKITLQHGYSPVSLLHIFRAPFYKNTPWGLLLKIVNDVLSFNYIRKTSFKDTWQCLTYASIISTCTLCSKNRSTIE